MSLQINVECMSFLGQVSPETFEILIKRKVCYQTVFYGGEKTDNRSFTTRVYFLFDSVKHFLANSRPVICDSFCST